MQEGADVEFVRPDAAQRVERAAEHVVPAFVFAGALDGLDVAGFFDDADQPAVAAGVGAVAAHLVGGDVPADAAEVHAVAHPRQRRLEAVDVLRFHLQQVEGDALRAFRPDAGQSRELIDEILKRSFEQFGGRS